MTLVRTPSPAADDNPNDPWRPRSHVELLAAQLRAIDEWHRLYGTGAASTVVPGHSREARLDEARRRDVAERERDALLARAAGALAEEQKLGGGDIPRAVVAHRNDWLRDKVASGLRDHGVEIVLTTDDGAEAGAAVVLDQPDLLFVEDLLPTLSGVDLVRRAHVLAPTALVAAHALGPSGLAPLIDAGARATFSRRIPPAEIAAELVACLHGQHSTLTLV